MSIGKTASCYLGLILGLIISVAVYYPGLFGGFEFDDTLNILDNHRVAISNLDVEHLRNALHSGFSGPLGRPIAMLSFAINFYFAGFNPFYFKLTNLIIHLLNGIGIFWLSCLIFQSYQIHRPAELSFSHIRWLSLAISTAWLLHPLNLTSVLYVVQRMTSLATLFTIGGLILYVRGRIGLCQGRGGITQILSGLLIFVPLSLLTKEIGVLAPLLMLVMEWVVFDFKAADQKSEQFLLWLFGVVVGLPLAIGLVLVIAHPELITGGYGMRSFTLVERLMTESRIIWFYLWMILLPNNSKLGIYHDDIAISNGLFSPVNTVFAIIGIFVLVGGAIGLRRRAPILSLGLLFFLAGHSLESTIIPLELAHEHRNYLPIYGILIIVFYYLLHPTLLAESARLRYALAMLFIALLGITTAVRSAYWGNLAEHGLIEAMHHPNSSRANYEGGRTAWMLLLASDDPGAKQKYYEQARQYFEQSAALQKTSINGLTGLIRLDYLMGKPLNTDLLARLRQRLEHEVFTPDSPAMLIGLSECQIDNQCQLPPSEMEAIFQSAFRNPTLHGQAAATVYAAAAMNVLVEGNTQLALEYANKAVASNPRDLQWRLNLANLLVALAQLDAAQEQVEIVDRLDELRSYTMQVRQLRESIRDAKNSINRNQQS